MAKQEKSKVSNSYPVSVEMAYPEKSSRLWAIATLLFVIPKIFALIPHLIILNFLGMAALFAMIIGQIAVLFTESYPRVLFDFIVGVTRWRTRVNAFIFGLTDKYPPFSLQ